MHYKPTALLIWALGCLILGTDCAPKHQPTRMALTETPPSGGPHGSTPFAEVESSTPGCASSETREVRSSVRSLEAAILVSLVEGCRRSPTLRRLVDEIGRTDGIVYVQAGPCPLSRLRGCLLHLVHSSGDARYLWIRVKTNVAPADLVATIAHELRHALEVLEQRWIRSRWDILQFYRSAESRAFSDAPPDGPFRTYETGTAIHLAATVRSEVTLEVGERE